MRKNTLKIMNGSNSHQTARLVFESLSSLHSRFNSVHEKPSSDPLLQIKGTIGISSYAANALGDVVYIELPSLDLEFGAGDTIGAVESVKSASDILTPISGKVVAKNDLLEEKPATINRSPEGEGWIAKIEVKHVELEGLMGEEEYRKFTEE